MKKIGVCGIYGVGPAFSGGQPVKTRMIIQELSYLYGEDEVQVVNTYNWRQNPFRLFINCFKLFRNCENVIILPAHNGIKVFALLFLLFNMFYHRRIHYIVIGGWLPGYIEKDRLLRKRISKFFGVYVETTTMKNALEVMGLTNVYIMNNFKKLTTVDIDNISIKTIEPFRLCLFSRIVKEKGIEDAIRSVIEANNFYGREVYHLDVYGFLDDSYKERFKEITKDLPSYIRYCGVVNPEESVHVLKSYFIQLFPTRYKTEGIPGSIIDSYFAGLPVLASRWDSFEDVIEEGKTGIGFNLYDINDLISKLKSIAENPQIIINMKKNCIRKSVEYSPDFVIGQFIKHL